MALRKKRIPRYGTVQVNGHKYYRTDVEDAEGKRVILYGKTREELYDKEMAALEKVDNITFRQKSPTVAEYCEKWLLIPKCLADCLRQVKATSISEYVIADSKGQPLADSQFKRLWQYVVVRSTKERTYYKYVNGQSIKCKVTPIPGGHQKNNPKLVYSLDFDVTPHQLRHTYITNLLYAGVDPKTVQYLAGHENSKTTMDIYAQVKYNKPEHLLSVVNAAFSAPVGA